jgi:tetratricopeptide (TPR) repeat protein
LRVNAQLVSTETATHLWSERFDVGRDGIGYGIDDIIRQIGIALNVKLIDIESIRSARERPTNPDAADVLLQARALDYRPVTPETQGQLVALYERAVELDPSSALPLAGLANAILDSITYEDPTTPAKLRRAEGLIARAELLRPDLAIVMWDRVFLLAQQFRCPELVPAAQRLNEAYPNYTGGHFRLGICLAADGKAADAIPESEQAIRLNPRNPQNFNRYLGIGFALVFLDRCDEAIPWFNRSLAANPGVGNRRNTLAAIAAAQALAGRTEDARSSADEAMRLWPTLTVRSYLRYKITNSIAVTQLARMLDGMRLAGIRDHADEDADFAVSSDNLLHSNYEARTPTIVPGAQIIGTHDLITLVDERKPLVVDASISWGKSIPGAIGLWGAGVGGSVSDDYQGRMGNKLHQLTHGDRNLPVVVMGWNSERYQGRNLALRLVALGYTNVYWYRGGREAWEVAGLPETDLVMQDW